MLYGMEREIMMAWQKRERESKRDNEK